jgi:hypothetical protein
MKEERGRWRVAEEDLKGRLEGGCHARIQTVYEQIY